MLTSLQCRYCQITEKNSNNVSSDPLHLSKVKHVLANNVKQHLNEAVFFSGCIRAKDCFVTDRIKNL